jgi:beta-phosphoglucomutase-like phosphatase (HAD superfamily)
LLDPDGVITDPARLHAVCWKQMPDEYLRKRAGLTEARCAEHLRRRYGI